MRKDQDKDNNYKLYITNKKDLNIWDHIYRQEDDKKET